MLIGSIVLHAHNSHLTRRQWRGRHRRQALTAAQTDTDVVTARLLHAHHMLCGLLLGNDLWFGLWLSRRFEWRQQIPGNHTKGRTIRRGCPGHRSANILILLLQLQEIVGQGAAGQLRRLGTFLLLLLLLLCLGQGYQLGLLHFHRDIR